MRIPNSSNRPAHQVVCKADLNQLRKVLEMSNETQDEKFNYIVDLVTHMCHELVDEPDALDITFAFSGNTGAIEVCGPSSEIGKVMGSKKRNFNAMQTVLFSVASKYGFRVNLNILNLEQRARFNPATHLDGPLLAVGG